MKAGVGVGAFFLSGRVPNGSALIKALVLAVMIAAVTVVLAVLLVAVVVDGGRLAFHKPDWWVWLRTVNKALSKKTAAA